MDERWDWSQGHMISHISMILELPSFLDVSSIEHAKYVKRIAVCILVKKFPNLMENWEKKPDRPLDKKTSSLNK